MIDEKKLNVQEELINEAVSTSEDILKAQNALLSEFDKIEAMLEESSASQP